MNNLGNVLSAVAGTTAVIAAWAYNQHKECSTAKKIYEDCAFNTRIIDCVFDVSTNTWYELNEAFILSGKATKFIAETVSYQVQERSGKDCSSLETFNHSLGIPEYKIIWLCAGAISMLALGALANRCRR
ncbi:MAG: hypothetical protein WCF65_05405 [Parachlamydiaceae bacterium]